MFSRVRDLLLARSVRGPAVLADVSIGGGRTTDRQQINFTGKGGDSQAGGWGLWINKCMYFSYLEIFARKVQRLKQACAGREIRSVSLVELGSQASVEAWRKQRGIWSRSASPFP